MEREWLIIPDFYNLEKSAALAQDYGASFEYNDFFDPMVYTDLEEVKRRVHTYKMLERDRSRDTLHGVFLDIVKKVMIVKCGIYWLYWRKWMFFATFIATILLVEVLSFDIWKKVYDFIFLVPQKLMGYVKRKRFLWE